MISGIWQEMPSDTIDLNSAQSRFALNYEFCATVLQFIPVFTPVIIYSIGYRFRRMKTII